MKIADAGIGMVVVGQHGWDGVSGTVVAIVPSPYQRGAKLLKIRLKDGSIHTWHPDHWEPAEPHNDATTPR